MSANPNYDQFRSEDTPEGVLSGAIDVVPTHTAALAIAGVALVVLLVGLSVGFATGTPDTAHEWRQGLTRAEAEALMEFNRNMYGENAPVRKVKQ